MNLDRPGHVRATAQDGTVSVSWDGVRGASSYRVQLVDLAADEPVGAAVVTSGTSASIPLGELSEERAGIEVEAWSALEPDGTPRSVSRSAGFVSAGPNGGTGARWQMFAPEDFSGDALRASFSQLAAGERLAVIALNAGGQDAAPARFEVTGTTDPDTGVAAAPVRSGLRAPATLPLLHEALRAHEQQLTPAVA